MIDEALRGVRMVLPRSIAQRDGPHGRAAGRMGGKPIRARPKNLTGLAHAQTGRNSISHSACALSHLEQLQPGRIIPACLSLRNNNHFHHPVVLWESSSTNEAVYRRQTSMKGDGLEPVARPRHRTKYFKALDTCVAVVQGCLKNLF